MLAAGVELRIEARRHAKLGEVERRDRFTFAFVRRPFDWYGSWWGYVRTGNRHLWAFLSAYPLDKFSVLPFPQFLEACAGWYPGWLSREFEEFVGRPDSQIEFVGRYESLQDDLVRALTLAGQDFDEDALRSVPPINTSFPPPLCSQEIKQALIRSERAAYERFYSNWPRSGRFERLSADLVPYWQAEFA